ncbi:MAG: class II glutamine amidotransferase, partial [Cyanobacteria bacterium J06559_3]
ISNCQPFQAENLLFTHNGYIKQFHNKLYRPMRQMMSDRAYTTLRGSTDSEHIWGLVLTALDADSLWSLETALEKSLEQLMTLAYQYDSPIAVNVLISNGESLVGSRLASHNRAPSLYWLKCDPRFPDAVLVASEPLFDGDWMICPESSLFTVNANCDVQFHSLSHLRQPYPG